MLIEFIVFGSWFATLGLVLFTYNLATIIGTAFMLCGVAAIASPLIMGAIGDRLMAPERLLALLHLGGAAIQFMLPGFVADGNSVAVLISIFAYMLLFQPTLGLVNSIAFDHLGSDREKFPYLRMFATLGWIVAGLVVGQMGLSASHEIFYVTAATSTLLAFYALTLPVTDIKSRLTDKKSSSLLDLIGGQSFSLFRSRSFSVLMLCTFLTAISLGFYNIFSSSFISALGIENVASILAIGQASELIFIFFVPFVVKQIGMKYTLLIGILMWGVRFVLFSYAAQEGETWAAIVGVALHGICNDFFLIICAMYIAQLAKPEMVAQGQSWLIIMISGFGALAASNISGGLFESYVLEKPVENWSILWSAPIAISIVTALIWFTLFKESKQVTS